MRKNKTEGGSYVMFYMLAAKRRTYKQWKAEIWNLNGRILRTSHMTHRGMSEPCVINRLRLEGRLTDAVIKIQDVDFQIHKVILCNCSPYFRWNKTPGTLLITL